MFSLKRKTKSRPVKTPDDKLKKKKLKENKKLDFDVLFSTNPIIQSCYKKFKSLNLVLTLIQTSKQQGCAFKTLKSSIEAQIKDLFTLDDLFQIVSIGEGILNCYKPSERGSDFIYKTEAAEDEDEVYVEFCDLNCNINKTGFSVKKNYDTAKGIEERNLLFGEKLLEFQNSLNETQDVSEILNLISENLKFKFKPRRKLNAENKIEITPKKNIEAVDILKLYKQYLYETRNTSLDEEESLHTLTVRPPCYKSFQDASFLSQNIKSAIQNNFNIDTLYSHQTEALEELENGKNLIVTTSTSSGKSLIFQLAILMDIEKNPNNKYMIIFPTKALAQDQLLAFNTLIATHKDGTHNFENVVINCFDGDVNETLRKTYRNESNVLITNFDILNFSILPSFRLWKNYFCNLKYIIVDELEYYNKKFGSYCSIVVKRIKRICEFLDNYQLKFISCSATLVYPKQIMADFFGLNSSDLALISDDGSPMGIKHLIILNPRDNLLASSSDTTCHREHLCLDDSCNLFCFLILNNVKTICFTKTRKTCELLYHKIQTKLKFNSTILDKCMSYRGGYQLETRRKIEADMFEGNLLGIVSTNALELGINIGTLTAVIHCGTPVSTSSYKQQCGRVGRKKLDSISILVSTYKLENEYFTRNSEPNNYLNYANVSVKKKLQMFAFELPILLSRDLKYFKDDFFLEDNSLFEDILKGEGFRYDDAFNQYCCDLKFKPISIRGEADEEFDAGEDHFFSVFDSKSLKLIEDIEIDRVHFTVYEGAVLVVQGKFYQILDINESKKMAKATLIYQIGYDENLCYITKPVDLTSLNIKMNLNVKQEEKGNNFASKLNFSLIDIKTFIVGYKKINLKNKVVFDEVKYPLDVCKFNEEQKGFNEFFSLWFEVSPITITELLQRQLNLTDSLTSLVNFLRFLAKRSKFNSEKDNLQFVNEEENNLLTLNLYDSETKSQLKKKNYTTSNENYNFLRIRFYTDLGKNRFYIYEKEKYVILDLLKIFKPILEYGLQLLQSCSLSCSSGCDACFKDGFNLKESLILILTNLLYSNVEN
ncbi:hypothetical protein HDU92_000778 [Lobulomyces angularis]|nr:hypothetical protein HDU92_000778 [Lobulomyces angularis]